MLVPERFIKYIPSEEALWLKKNHPWAFLLLTTIAERVRIFDGSVDGLKKGQCHLGDHASFGATRQQYRTAINVLTSRLHVKIEETCRTRQKSTTGTTTVGTLVSLISSTIYDINIKHDNHQSNHRPTTDQPPTNHEQEDIKTDENQIDHDLIDARDTAFDLIFEHKKHGKVGIVRESLISEMHDSKNSRQDVEVAIQKMIKQNPVLNGTIQAYLTTILKNNKEKPCKTTTTTTKKAKVSKTKSEGSNETYVGKDLSESPLAIFSLQNGCS